MKHLIFLLCICYAVNSYGQTDKPIAKGNMLLGGSAGFSYSNASSQYQYTDLNFMPISQTNEVTDLSLSLYPSVGYFVADGLAIGISPSLSLSHYKSGDNVYNGYGVGIGPFIKAYFTSGFFVSLQPGISYSMSKSGDNKSSTIQFNINPSLGYAFFINPKVSLEPSIGYSYNKVIYKYQSITNETTKTSRLFFSIGFQVFL
jgi:hypothetical protein